MLDLFCSPNDGRGLFAAVAEADDDLLARIPPADDAACVPDDGLLVDSSSNPLREFEFAFALLLLLGACGGGRVSLFRFFPNFFFVGVSDGNCGGGDDDCVAELILKPQGRLDD